MSNFYFLRNKEEVVTNKYWMFSCEISNDFIVGKEDQTLHTFMEIVRQRLIKTPIKIFSEITKKNKTIPILIEWRINKNKVNGYIEWNREVTESFMKRKYKLPFTAFPVPKKEFNSDEYTFSHRAFKSKRILKEFKQLNTIIPIY